LAIGQHPHAQQNLFSWKLPFSGWSKATLDALKMTFEHDGLIYWPLINYDLGTLRGKRQT